MRWYDMLWVGPQAEKKRRRLIQDVKKGAGMPGAYLITLAENPKEMLDIIQARKSYLRDDLYIVGIAMGKQEALELVEKIVEYVYRCTGGVDIRNFFLDNRVR